MGGVVAVCCDGTWNDPDDQTNVHRTYRLLGRCLADASEEMIGDDRRVTRGTAADGRRVCVYYDTGVGTRRWQKGSGRLFGAGLGENIRQAYAFLAADMAPDDELFLFGFSRGAFTVRSLCGLLGCAGLPARASAAAVEAAWRFYRVPPGQRAGSAQEAELVRHEPRGAKVRFLGVYDTVGSLGVPVPQLRWVNGLVEWLLGGVIRFHDAALGRNVETACQALAIHERRGTFKPVVWSRAPGLVRRPDGSLAEQRVLQVWFAGSHADVGGGYPQADLSDIPFDWMMRRAMEEGLQVREEVLRAAAGGNCYGSRHDSDRSWIGRVTNGELLQTARAISGGLPLGLGAFAWLLDLAGNLFTVRSADRRIGGEVEDDDGTFCVPVGERIHSSVLDRYRGEHMPESVHKALAARVEVFRERSDARRPGAGATSLVNNVACAVEDVSAAGARVGGAAWLVPGSEVTFQGPLGQAVTAAVVWQRDDEAGLRLLGIEGGAEPPAAPPPAARRVARAPKREQLAR